MKLTVKRKYTLQNCDSQFLIVINLLLVMMVLLLLNRIHVKDNQVINVLQTDRVIKVKDILKIDKKLQFIAQILMTYRVRRSHTIILYTNFRNGNNYITTWCFNLSLIFYLLKKIITCLKSRWHVLNLKLHIFVIFSIMRSKLLFYEYCFH